MRNDYKNHRHWGTPRFRCFSLNTNIKLHKQKKSSRSGKYKQNKIIVIFKHTHCWFFGRRFLRHSITHLSQKSKITASCRRIIDKIVKIKLSQNFFHLSCLLSAELWDVRCHHVSELAQCSENFRAISVKRGIWLK